MFTIRAVGSTRQGEYTATLTTNNITVERVSLNIEPEAQFLNGDVVTVEIVDSETMSNQKESWVVFFGEATAITEFIEEEFPMTKFETQMIYDALDSEPENANVFYTYAINDDVSAIILGSPTHRVLEKCHIPIIADMFERSRSDLKLLVH